MAAKKKTTRKKTTRKKSTTKKKEPVVKVEKELTKIEQLRLALEEAKSNPDPDPKEIEAIQMALSAAIEIPETWFE